MNDRERERVSAARVGRLATVRPDGRPHVVAVTYALVGDRVVTVVDAKPKRSKDLQRLRNIAVTPRASLLVDHYDDEDWSQLWWVRLDGDAEVTPNDRRVAELVAALVAKYPQYRADPPAGPVIVLTVRSSTSWSASGGLAPRGV